MTGPERLVRLEAAAYLLSARGAVRVVPFRWLVRLFERAPRKPEVQGEARAESRAEVRQAVHRAAQRLPGETVCFPKAMAAQAMLRRRGIRTTICCGASKNGETGLTAHVWLEDGEHPVTGARAREGYLPLARYSPKTRMESV
jgi:Transglutaminase-like superfamily